MTRLTLNGEPRDVDEASLPAVLALLGIDAERGGVAVAVNGAVVARGAWADTALRDGDQVEVLTAVQGG